MVGRPTTYDALEVYSVLDFVVDNARIGYLFLHNLECLSLRYNLLESSCSNLNLDLNIYAC